MLICFSDCRFPLKRTTDANTQSRHISTRVARMAHICALFYMCLRAFNMQSVDRCSQSSHIDSKKLFRINTYICTFTAGDCGPRRVSAHTTKDNVLIVISSVCPPDWQCIIDCIVCSYVQCTGRTSHTCAPLTIMHTINCSIPGTRHEAASICAWFSS